MDNLLALQNLDFILEFYRNKTDYVISSINAYKELTENGKTVKADEISMIVRQLERDGYLDFSPYSDKEKMYHITYAGYLFHGYVKQDEINKKDEQVKNDKEKRIRLNEKSLTYGTWLAGIGSTGLLIWEMLKILFLSNIK